MAAGAGRSVLLAAALVLATGLAAAACHDTSVSCLDNGIPYAYSLPGDSAHYFHWPPARMPLKVYAEPVGNLPANTDAAITLWSGIVRCGNLSMVRTADSTQADIIIGNPAFLPPAPPADAAHPVLWADSVGACIGKTSPVIDDSSAPWKLIPPIHAWVAHQGSDSLATEACYHFTVAHELGHALGLFSHSPNPDDLMNALPKRRVVTGADRVTLQLLYSRTPTIGLAP